jgi:hypothetical protein
MSIVKHEFKKSKELDGDDLDAVDSAIAYGKIQVRLPAKENNEFQHYVQDANASHFLEHECSCF